MEYCTMKNVYKKLPGNVLTTINHEYEEDIVVDFLNELCEI